MAGVVTPGRQPLAVLPFVGDGARRPRPSRRAASASRIAAAVSRMRSKQSKTCAVAVDVPLGDLPVVGAGVARLAGVAEDDALLELGEIDVERHALDAVDLELQRRDAAVERRAVVLQAGGHVDRLRLDVHGDLQQRLGLVVRALPLGQRGADGDVQRRRAGDAGAGRRFRRVVSVMPRASKKCTSSDEQPQLAASRSSRQSSASTVRAGVLRADDDARVVARFDTRAWRGG